MRKLFYLALQMRKSPLLLTGFTMKVKCITIDMEDKENSLQS